MNSRCQPSDSSDYIYRIYGLIVQSSHQLPGLPAIDDCANVDVSVELAGEWSDWKPGLASEGSQAGASWGVKLHIAHQGEFAHIRYLSCAGGIDFRMRQDGGHVRVQWTGGATLDWVKSLLCHPVLGYVARLRGQTCLHACVVSVGGQAIAVAGPAGAGKSTTAAALVRLGCQMVSEDVAVLLERGGGFWVYRGHNQPCLDRHTIRSLFGDDSHTVPIFPGPDSVFHKAHLTLASGDGAATDPVPLAAVYLLAERGARDRAPVIQAKSTAEGLLALTANTFAAAILSGSARVQEFEALGRLARQVPIRVVQRPDDLAQLPAICRAVLDDVNSLQRRA